MKKYFVIATFLLLQTAFGQSYSSNSRRITREVEKMMEVSTQIIDEVMTYGKAKKVEPLIDEQFTIYRKSKRSFARLTDESEAELVAVVEEALGEIVELNADQLRLWFEEDPRSNFGHTYVSAVGEKYTAIMAKVEEYNTTYEVNFRGSDAWDRINSQLELLVYTKEMKRGAATVDSLVDVIKSEIGHTDLDELYAAQKLLVKTLSKHLRGYGEEQFYNGQTELHEAYQKYYFELLELASADLLSDLTKMKYDLMEGNAIASSTESSAFRTMSFFDNEKKLLAKRESRFVKRNLPKPLK